MIPPDDGQTGVETTNEGKVDMTTGGQAGPTEAAPDTSAIGVAARGRSHRSGQGPARVLRAGPQHQGHQPRLSGQRGDGVDRAVRIREIDRGAVHQPDARGDSGCPGRRGGPARRARRVRGGNRRHVGTAPDRHGVPEAEPLPDDVDLRQRCGRPAADRARSRTTFASVSTGHCARSDCGARSRTG